MRRAIVSLKTGNIEWTAELIGNKSVSLCNNIYSIKKANNHQDDSWEIRREYLGNDDSLWVEKLEEIRRFQSEQPENNLTTQQVENLISIYNQYRHVFSDIPGKMCHL